jgi:hypothetical protein
VLDLLDLLEAQDLLVLQGVLVLLDLLDLLEAQDLLDKMVVLSYTPNL